MAETIITIDIATLLKSGIQTAMSGVALPVSQATGEAQTVTYRFDGVRDDSDTVRESLLLPVIACRVHEGINHEQAQASRLRDYPVSLVVATHYDDDPFQIALYTLAQNVGQYVLGPPTLVMAAATFRRMSLPQPPQRADDGRVQMIAWECMVGVYTSA